jgi:hypothetical protein
MHLAIHLVQRPKLGYWLQIDHQLDYYPTIISSVGDLTQVTHGLVISTSGLPTCAVRVTVPGPRSTCLDITSNRGRILGISSRICFGFVTHLPYGLSKVGCLF